LRQTAQRLRRILFRLNYFDAPVVKEQGDEFLVLESIRNKVWNPVFTIGTVAFVLSMTLRGFFDQALAVIPLGLSTLVLFSGVWILSATATVVFDKKESKAYFVYKHLGYLQKVYMHPLTSFDEVRVINSGNSKRQIRLLKDDGTDVMVAAGKERELIQDTGNRIAAFLGIPLKVA
jgi:hypothetical protein